MEVVLVEEEDRWKLWCSQNQKMDSTRTEDPEIPILPNRVRKSRRCLCLWWPSRTDPKAALPSQKLDAKDSLSDPRYYLAAVGFFVFLLILGDLVGGIGMDFKKPDIRFDSVYVCPTNASNNFVIWDLKFDITNTDNQSLCIPQFEVSVFSYNRTQLLAKATVIPTHACLGSRSHTSAQALVEDSLQDSSQTNGTIRFDLKFHAKFEFAEDGNGYYAYAGDVVCKDAKVAFSASCNSSCGCMITVCCCLTPVRLLPNAKNNLCLILDGCIWSKWGD